MVLNNQNFLMTSLTEEQLCALIKDQFTETFQEMFCKLQENLSLKESPSKAAQDNLLNRKEACDFLGVSFPTLKSWTDSGKIKGYEFGNRIRYKKDELLASFEPVVIIQSNKNSTQAKKRV
jgi:excisionase family DNA binding protein